MKSIRIVSDGTNNGTRVYTHEGHEITGITKIEFEPIEGGSSSVISARLTFIVVNLGVTAETEVE